MTSSNDGNTNNNNNSNDNNKNGKRPPRDSAARKVPAPARKPPGTERGLTHSPYFNWPLYERMSEDLHLGGMSERTHEGYLRAMRQLADFCKRSPDQISEDQLRKFFLHLKNDKEFASGSLRVAFSGVKFFYTRTCKRDWQTLAQMKIQNVKSLPEVLTIEQVHQIIDRCTTLRMAVYFWTVYSLGLRLEEGLNLHIGKMRREAGGLRCFPPVSSLIPLASLRPQQSADDDDLSASDGQRIGRCEEGNRCTVSSSATKQAAGGKRRRAGAGEVAGFVRIRSQPCQRSPTVCGSMAMSF